MKFKTLENGTNTEVYDLFEEGHRKKATITALIYCKVEYEGRALSQLNWGERILIIKPDGTFLIHQDKNVAPINWQPPKSRNKSYLKGNNLIIESYKRTPKERITVEIRKCHLINIAILEDYEELEIAGYEKDMGDTIMANPHIIEEGFIPTNREFSTEHGFIDILGKDKNNNTMVLELKSRKAGINAVKQLKRYLSDFEDENQRLFKEKRKIRGLLVAPAIGEDAKELIEKEGIEFVEVHPPKELKIDKKVTLDNYFF